MLSSSYVLTLPQGWAAKSVTFNHAPITPTVSGSTYTWELSNLRRSRLSQVVPRVSSLAPAHRGQLLFTRR